MSIYRQPGSYTWGESGLVATAVHSIDAEDEAEALTLLAAASPWAVERGVVFETHQGTIPDAACICQSLSVAGKPHAPVGGTGLYIVTSNFARNTPQQGPDPTTTNVASWYVERSSRSQPADHDLFGQPIVNTADEPIDPPLTREIISRVLVAKWYASGTSWLNVYNQFKVYEGKVNSAPFAGAASGSLRCQSVEPTEAGPERFLMTARFEYREPRTLFGQTYDGWQDTILNLGRRTRGQIVSGKREYPPIIVNGVPVSDPVPLDGQGQRLADGHDPVVLAFTHYAEIDFSQMGFT